MTTSNRLGITELAATQTERSVTVNEAIAKLEAGATFYAAIQVLVNAPPASPVEGDLYVVGTAGSGAWSGHSEEVTVYYNAAWLFMAPIEGMFAWDQTSNSLKYYDGANWVAYAASGAIVADGDYGDVTVSSSGTVWTVDTGAVHALEVAFGPTGMAHTTATNVEDALQDLDDAITSAATESFIIACSDESSALTTGTAKITFRMPYAFTVTAVRASLTTAQSSGSIFTVDINEGGTTILSTKLTIDNTEKTSTTAATPAVISDASLADDAEMTIDIDQVGSGTATGLKVEIIGHK